MEHFLTLHILLELFGLQNVHSTTCNMKRCINGYVNWKVPWLWGSEVDLKWCTVNIKCSLLNILHAFKGASICTKD